MYTCVDFLFHSIFMFVFFFREHQRGFVGRKVDLDRESIDRMGMRERTTENRSFASNLFHFSVQ